MPTFFHVMVSRIRALFRPGDLDRDFDQELETHLAMAEEDNVRRGMTPEQARRAARVELGALAQLREAGREARGLPWLGTFWLDIKRRREIGIRSALGARPRRLLAAVFRRALGQVAAGFVVGILLALLVDYYLPIEAAGGRNVPGVIPGAAAFMIVVGLLAALGPARRGLRVDPTEALRG